MLHKKDRILFSVLLLIKCDVVIFRMFCELSCRITAHRADFQFMLPRILDREGDQEGADPLPLQARKDFGMDKNELIGDLFIFEIGLFGLRTFTDIEVMRVNLDFDTYPSLHCIQFQFSIKTIQCRNYDLRVNLRRHEGQEISIFPFPRGTRTFCPHCGQV